MHTHTHKHMDTYKHALTLTLFSSKLSLSQQTLFHSHSPTFILSHTLSHALSQSHSFHFIRFIHSLSLPLYRFTLSLPFLSLSLSLYHSCYLSLATVLPSHCLPPLSHSICLSSLTLCASLQFLTHSLSPFSPSHTHTHLPKQHTPIIYFLQISFVASHFKFSFNPRLKRKEKKVSSRSSQLNSSQGSQKLFLVKFTSIEDHIPQKHLEALIEYCTYFQIHETTKSRQA